jgi:hypothetical protein
VKKFDKPFSEVLIAPERKPHGTRTDLAVAKGYLVVAERRLQAPDEHDFFIDDIFHIATRPPMLVEAGKGAGAFGGFVDYFLRYVARHFCHRVPCKSNVAVSYYTLAMQSNCPG